MVGGPQGLGTVAAYHLVLPACPSFCLMSMHLEMFVHTYPEPGHVSQGTSGHLPTLFPLMSLYYVQLENWPLGITWSVQHSTLFLMGLSRNSELEMSLGCQYLLLKAHCTSWKERTLTLQSDRPGFESSSAICGLCDLARVALPL